MIDKLEIDEKAKEFEIHPVNVEKDYVFGWLLFVLFTKSELKEDIFLKGGNALRKGYFANTRFSSDLDFGIPFEIDQDTLTIELNKVCDFIQEKAGITFVKEDLRIEEKFEAAEAPIPSLQVWEARIYFKDFYGKADHFKLKIAMDVTQYDKVLLDLQSVNLIHPYSDASNVECKIRCMKLEEIIATKLKCLLQRQHAPDLFDYVHAVKRLGGNLNKEEVVDTFIRKTIFGRNPHTVKNILLRTSFDYFRRSWEKGIICAKHLIFEVEDAISYFIVELEGLFEIYPDNGYGAFAYFPSEMRTAIMEAGRNQTRLKIRYKSTDRLIEPYSLKYLQRKDGKQREYFYVYNCSGGGKPPGVRCFVHENIQSIESTDEKFDPRYQIELSKAGEKPENPYLFDPNRPERSTTPRISILGRRSRTIKYVYKCGHCGKSFIRSIRDHALKPHKSKSGYQCGGRTGYYVTTKYS
jgi:predicted nucleotidyltransferase component of viral defense system